MRAIDVTCQTVVHCERFYRQISPNYRSISSNIAHLKYQKFLINIAKYRHKDVSYRILVLSKDTLVK